MSKFCANCGNMMDDADTMCSACGMPYNNPEGQQYSNPAPGQIPTVPAKQPFDIKKNLPLIGGVAGGVVLLIVIIAIIASVSGGYKKPIKNMVKAMATGDAELFIKNYSLLDNDGYELSEDDQDDIDEYISDYSEDFEDSYGEYKKIKIEVKNVEKLDDDDIEDMYEDFVYDEDDADVALDNITAAKDVKVSIEIIGKDDTYNIRNQHVYVVKENGKWKVLFSSILGDYDY